MSLGSEESLIQSTPALDPPGSARSEAVHLTGFEAFAAARSAADTRGAATASSGSNALRAWISLLYWWRFRRLPDLASPRLFTELVQVRKLEDRDPRFPLLADKINAKGFVARELGEEWVIPCLWHGHALPADAPWPKPFVVKSAHGCLQSMFVRDDSLAWEEVRSRAHSWLGRTYGGMLGEWLYSQIEPRLLVEPFVGQDGQLPTDYKFFVFGGKVELIQVDNDREHALRRAMFDRDWNRLPLELEQPDDPRTVAPPESLALMTSAAEVLGRNFDFVRVDFYEVAGRPLFGEMTFYAGSGLSRFRPESFDAFLGSRWLRAKTHRAAQTAGRRPAPALCPSTQPGFSC